MISNGFTDELAPNYDELVSTWPTTTVTRPTNYMIPYGFTDELAPDYDELVSTWPTTTVTSPI